MPIFDFRCTVCGDEQEKFVSKDEIPIHCDLQMKKLVTFKGSYVFKGLWYTTEYGTQEHNLNPADQARRAARELKECGMVQANPTMAQSPQRDSIEAYKRRREAGI